MRRYDVTFLFIACFVLISLAYTNCGSMRSNEIFLENLASYQMGCEQGLNFTFQKTFHPFFQKAGCNGCHVGGSPVAAPGEFGDPDPTRSFISFFSQGYGTDKQKFEFLVQRAGSDNHNTASSSFKPELENLRSQWLTSLDRYQVCSSNQSGATAFMAKTATKSPSTEKLQYDLGSDLVRGGPYAGAIFTVNIKVIEMGGKKLYEITSPKLKTGGSALHAETIRLYVNGQFISTATTYSQVAISVPANQEMDLTVTNSNPMLVELANQPRPTDTFAFEFETLKKQE